jgi:asparagine synthase (glutamine-hydrolysing)
MSGIVGMLNLDGAPVERDLLDRMTNSLAFRGPDALKVWRDERAGFGHALLKTTDEAERERQPFTLDGVTWIVADARIDARRGLVSELLAHGRPVSCDLPDVELLWHSYQIWQERCVDHVLGDFAFAVWDIVRRRLFCARDHLGVKPFYYAQLGQAVVFSNTLDCVRQHPAVSDRLNDRAVGDFLLFGLNLDTDTTIFADIQQIPPGHTVIWSEGTVERRRYWSLPIDEPIFYRRADDYVAHFRELLYEAVSDRLRIDRVGVFMSGGIDSPSLAATARDQLRRRTGDGGVYAFTKAYDGYDEERHYAGLVASHLGLGIDVRDGIRDLIDADWMRTSVRTPQPVPYPTNLSSDLVYHNRVASYSRVVLYGEGPDNALKYEWRPYVSYLLRSRRFARLASDLCSHCFRHRRIPLLSSIPRIVRERLRSAPGASLPDWFNYDVEDRVRLGEHLGGQHVERKSAHAIRPSAYHSLVHPRWQDFFRSCDGAYTTGSLEVRHPYMDVRLLRFLLAVPPVPWCRRKYLMRRAMRGMLPEAVLARPKSPLVRDPWDLRVRESGLPPLQPVPALTTYVDAARASTTPATDPSFWIAFRVCSLNYWLQNQGRQQETMSEDAPHGTIRERGEGPVRQSQAPGVQQASAAGIR